MNARAFLAAVLVLACSGCAAKAAAPQATPEPSLIATRGKSFPLSEARRKIAFRPYMPSRDYIDVAMLPAFFGGDDPKNWGLGLEYSVNGKRFALSQWPQREHMRLVLRGSTVTTVTPASCALYSTKERSCAKAHPD